MRILHISDTHAEGETMRQLEHLAQKLKDCEVVACTGDCISTNTNKVPESWNKWPQRLKLLVPGNHGDTPQTFVYLTKWTTNVPWYRTDGEISFIGLNYCRAFREQLEELAPAFERRSQAVVVLSHMWPSETQAKLLAAKLRKFFSRRPILYLHGDNHSLGAHWDQQAKLDDLPCCRSNIISSATGNRGVAHLITWSGREFTCKRQPGFPLNAILPEAE